VVLVSSSLHETVYHSRLTFQHLTVLAWHWIRIYMISYIIRFLPIVFDGLYLRCMIARYSIPLQALF
jgi:hypothetical protein